MQLLSLVQSRRKMKKRHTIIRTPKNSHPSRRNTRQAHNNFIETGILTFSLVIVLHALTLDTKKLTVEHMEGKT